VNFESSQVILSQHLHKADAMADALCQDISGKKFLAKVKQNNLRHPLPLSIKGTQGHDNIVVLWRNYYKNLLNCTSSNQCHMVLKKP